jgi:hypothetical protein
MRGPGDSAFSACLHARCCYFFTSSATESSRLQSLQRVAAAWIISSWVCKEAGRLFSHQNFKGCCSSGTTVIGCWTMMSALPAARCTAYNADTVCTPRWSRLHMLLPGVQDPSNQCLLHIMRIGRHDTMTASVADSSLQTVCGGCNSGA